VTWPDILTMVVMGAIGLGVSREKQIILSQIEQARLTAR